MLDTRPHHPSHLHQFPISPPHLHLAGTNNSFHAPQLAYEIRSPTPLDCIGQEGAVVAARGVSSIIAVLCRRSDPKAARLHNHDYQRRGNPLLSLPLGLWMGNLGPRRYHAFARYKQAPRNRHIPDPVVREFRCSVALLGNATTSPSNFIPLKHDDGAWLHFLLTVALTLRAPLCKLHGTGRQTGWGRAHNEAHKLIAHTLPL